MADLCGIKMTDDLSNYYKLQVPSYTCPDSHENRAYVRISGSPHWLCAGTHPWVLWSHSQEPVIDAQLIGYQVQTGLVTHKPG